MLLCRSIPLSAVLLFCVSTLGAESGRPLASTVSPHGRLKLACDTCHSIEDWKVIRNKIKFDHGKTGFPLRGRHTTVACRDCHDDLNFANTPNKCQDCHADLHRRKNGAECELCHNTNGWSVSIHNINEHQDRFPLIGAHAVVDCYSCHKVELWASSTGSGFDGMHQLPPESVQSSPRSQSSRFRFFHRLPRMPLIDR
jgi:hypothetical protein